MPNDAKGQLKLATCVTFLHAHTKALVSDASWLSIFRVLSRRMVREKPGFPFF